MRNKLVTTVLTAAIASSVVLTLGITRAQERDDDRRRLEERYHQSARDEGWWRDRLFLRVREDLDHVQSVTFPFSADQYRLSRVKQELNELQDRYANKIFSGSDLDDVISALQRVVTDNHLSGRDRDMLQDDLNRLREFREHHEGYR